MLQRRFSRTLVVATKHSRAPAQTLRCSGFHHHTGHVPPLDSLLLPHTPFHEQQHRRPWSQNEVSGAATSASLAVALCAFYSTTSTTLTEKEPSKSRHSNQIDKESKESQPLDVSKGRKEVKDSQENDDSNTHFDITQFWRKSTTQESMDSKNRSSNQEAADDDSSLDHFWKRVISMTDDEDIHQEKDKENHAKQPQAQDDTFLQSIGGLVASLWDSPDKQHDEDNPQQRQQTKKKTEQENISSVFDSMASKFMALVQGKQDDSTIVDLIAKARERSDQGDVDDDGGLTEIIKMFDMYKDALVQVADKYLGDLDLSLLSPTAVLYYMEKEDEEKNPSWQRRRHRFCWGVDIKEVYELNDALELANLSYVDTVAEIRQGLEDCKTPYELIYAEVRSKPGQPANFVAIQRDQSSRWGSGLKVIIVIRGTKSAADAITDLLCDCVDYKGGKAHSFIVDGGKYIVDKHKELLLNLLKQSGKSKMNLTLIGHSLGAGAASIAGMELKDAGGKIDPRVIGFGCPALVSKDLAEKSDYITTVVNDSDMVPRLSGPSAANLLGDILEFNWLPYAQRDIQQALEEIQARQPMIFNKDVTKTIYDIAQPLMEQHSKDTRMEGHRRLEVELFPPGRCLHFYRDGSGFSGNVVPNTFFSEIDLTRRMIDDHLFHSGYQETLLAIVRQHTGDHHFRFDNEE